MFISALSGVQLLNVIGIVSAWTGLPEYSMQIAKMRKLANVWLGVTIAAPFLAAWFLGVGRTTTAPQSGSSRLAWNGFRRRTGDYLRLLLSVLGAVGFGVLLLLIGFLLFSADVTPNE